MVYRSASSAGSYAPVSYTHLDVYKRQVLGRAARNTANIKNRQPIGRMFVKAETALPEFYQEIIQDELNVKKVEFLSLIHI